LGFGHFLRLTVFGHQGGAIMKHLSNLPPGCTDADIERAAGPMYSYSAGPWLMNEVSSPQYGYSHAYPVFTHKY